MTFAAMHLRSNINSKVVIRVLMQALQGTSTYEIVREVVESTSKACRPSRVVQAFTSSTSPSHVVL